MANVVPPFSPMLASSGPVAAPASAWAFEPKLDGWRVLVYIDDGLTVRTRNGHLRRSFRHLGQHVAQEVHATALPGGAQLREGASVVPVTRLPLVDGDSGLCGPGTNLTLEAYR